MSEMCLAKSCLSSVATGFVLLPMLGLQASATVLMVAQSFGMPVSTTHAITTSILGVGCAKRFSALKLNVVERIIWAWFLTLPLTAGLGWALMRLVKSLGL